VNNNNRTLLEIKDLRTYFYVKAGTVKAVDGISLQVDPGVKLGLVGESGSGKTTMALAMMRLVRPPGTIQGSIRLDGVDLLSLNEEEMRRMRLNHISMIPQGAMNSLNPVMRVKDQILDGMIDHGHPFKGKEKDHIVNELLKVVELPERVARLYPHELSGGMKQRVCMAIAIAMHPKVLIADEPTSALDVVIQRQVMETITRLVKEMNLSMILIGHDMGLMAQSVDRLAVMYAGKMMEVADIRDMFNEPLHPYTIALIESLPALGNRGVFQGIPGIPPSVINPQPGCPFHNRCSKMMDNICPHEMPAYREVRPGRWVACHLYN
jgi:oligopeptide/dipeptide ABC transporter ATP-binding protein